MNALSTEAEMASAGLTGDEFAQVLKTVENELPTLHEIRRRLIPRDVSPMQADLFGAAVP